MNIIVYLAYLLKKENCQKNSDIKFNDFFVPVLPVSNKFTVCNIQLSFRPI